MMRSLGKLLQVAGLVLLPAAMVMQLTSGLRARTSEDNTISVMLLLMVFGVALFVLGRVAEAYGRP
jgi:hypothetical protein